MLDGLAFLPICDLTAGLQHLCEITLLAADYFDATYINGMCRPAPANSTSAEAQQRILPRFSSETWNVHQLTLDNKNRMNNFADAWNRRFQCMLEHSHLSIRTIIEMLRADDAEAVTTLAKLKNTAICLTSVVGEVLKSLR